MIIRLFAAMAAFLFFSITANATFLPPDEINYEALKMYPEASNMTKAEFDAIVNKIEGIYRPIVSKHGGRLKVSADWNDDELNASAIQFFGTWQVNLYGGLARFPLMTNDAFAMVFCHELGHHLAGFAFHDRGGLFGGVWAANEGQSDYFAAHECARRVWHDEPDVNATFRGQIPEVATEACDHAWKSQQDRDLCYRVNAAASSLAASLDALRKQKDPNNKDPEPAFDTPDSNVVNSIDNSHPRAQCRLDTTFAASLCPVEFDPYVIPGKAKKDPFGVDAEEEAALMSCTNLSGYTVGLRPACWYYPRM